MAYKSRNSLNGLSLFNRGPRRLLRTKDFRGRFRGSPQIGPVRGSEGRFLTFCGSRKSLILLPISRSSGDLRLVFLGLAARNWFVSRV